MFDLPGRDPEEARLIPEPPDTQNVSLGKRCRQAVSAHGIAKGTFRPPINLKCGRNALQCLRAGRRFFAPLLSGRLKATQGGKPIRHRLSNDWASTAEMTYATEQFLTTARNPEILDPNIRNLPTATTRFEWVWSRHREGEDHHGNT
jgi:hypothetical protein